MGLSPILLLRYPELNDPANVPTDMRELTDDIEAAVGGVLPQPVGRYNSTAQNISSIDPNAETSLNPVATLRNPHTKLYLLVSVRFSGWVDCTGVGTAPGNAAYVSCKTSGQTAYYDSGGIRLENIYAAGAGEGIVTVAPGATLTAQPKGHRNNTVALPTINYVRTVLTPMGWLKTGVIS